MLFYIFIRIQLLHMKYSLLVLFSFLLPTYSMSQGMWQPNLLDEATINDMRSKGFQLDKQMLYSTDKPSIKDAIVIFGGGCTGEIIGQDGLLVTNHHCGLGNIQRLSSVDRDYLTNGYWAKNKNEELPCKGLSVSFIVRIDDVTDKILPVVSDLHNEIIRSKRVDSISTFLINESIKGTNYTASVVPFYNGNQYFLITTEVFTDIRLVGAPPISIGNYGGDTDNWMWPRHTGDFSLFRIYANAANQPAEYSADNKPYKPKYVLPVSASGFREGDFTMVYGFPGRTQQYLTSYAVDLVANVANPVRVDVRTKRLAVWESFMKQNDTIRIQYQAKYNGVSNAWKKWQGEMKGLRECNVILQKKELEKKLIEKSADEYNVKSTLGLMSLYYDSIRIYQSVLDYTTEALIAPEVYKIVETLKSIVDDAETKNFKLTTKEKDALKLKIKSWFLFVNSKVDEAVFNELIPVYWNNVPAKYRIKEWDSELKKYNYNIERFCADIYPRSFIDNESLIIKWIDELSSRSKKQLESDPLYRIAVDVNNYSNVVLSKYREFNTPLIGLNREYMNQQMQLMPDKKFFPDANSTLRISYGIVSPYNPFDAITYNWFTTSEGILEKYYSAKAEDYSLLPQYETMLKNERFGKYADKDGALHTCFIASNHTTGGNSGSPVLNARGELVGINFDRVWEGTMSDIYFDKDRCRNISLDTRYMLYIIDELGKSSYLFNEMTIMW